MTIVHEHVLLCRVRARLCALPVRHVIETLRPLPIEPLKGMPSFVLGVALIRAAPVPVVDPGVLLACLESPRPERFLLLRAGERRLAFAVEEVLGVRALAAPSLVQLAPLLRDAGVELLSSLATLDAELLLVLRATSVLSEELWSELMRGAA